MANRIPISKKLRFTVLQRDKFRCVYCGAEPEEKELQVDHVKPVSKGGNNELFNLVTSCRSCNIGKFTRELDDHTEISLRKDLIDEMMDDHIDTIRYIQAKIELENIKEKEAQMIADYMLCHFDGYSLTDKGFSNLLNAIDKFGRSSVLEVFDTQRIKYCHINTGIQDQLERTLDSTYKVLYSKNKPEHLQKISYIIGILRNKLHYVNTKMLGKILNEYYNLGHDLDILIEHAKNSEFKSYTHFKEYIISINEQ